MISLGLAPRPDLIMKELRAYFYPLIDRRDPVYHRVGKNHKDWTQKKYKQKNVVGSTTLTEDQEPSTEQEKEFVKAVKTGIEYDERVAGLIFYWTDKSLEEQGRILSTTTKGMNWRKKLAEDSKDHMLKLAKQMTDNAVSRTLNDLRTLSELGNAFGDILYDEQELRERNKGLSSA